MAILDGGLLGKSKGKVGNIVTGSDVKKQVTARAYQPNVANPRTAAQIKSRVIIAGASKLTGAYLAGIGAKMYETVPGNYPNARGYLVATMRKGTTDTIVSSTGVGFANTDLLPDATAFATMGIRWASGRISNGNIYLDELTDETPTTVAYTLRWNPAVFSGYDEATDRLYVTCLNVTTGSYTTSFENSVRSDAQASGTITLPTRTAGDYLIITAFFGKTALGVEYKNVSNGYTLGGGYIAANGSGWSIYNLSGNNDIFG